MKSAARILFAVLVTASSMSCDDDSSGKLKLKSQLDSDNNKVLFSYSGNHLIRSRTLYGPSLHQISETNFEYDGDQLTKATTHREYGYSIVTLEYDDSGLLINEVLTQNYEASKFTLRSVFEYDENRILKSKTLIPSDPDDPLRKTEFIWSNGNIVQINVSTIDATGKVDLLDSRFFEYDSKRNYTNQNIAFMYTLATVSTDETVLSKNNVVTSKYEQASDPGLIVSFTCEYTYNVLGYPREISRSLWGRQINYQLDY